MQVHPTPTRSLLFLSLLLVGASPAPAQAPDYTGDGWAQRMPGFDPEQVHVVALETYDADGNHLRDVAELWSDGKLTVSRDAAEHGRYELVATGVVAMAVVPTASLQRLVVSDGTQLSEITYVDQSSSWTSTEIDGAQSWGGTFLRGVTPGATPGLLVIPSDGSQVRHVTPNGSQWQASTLVNTDPTYGSFHQADILEWAGVERLAVVSDIGLDILELTNAQSVQHHAAPPDDALLAVIPAQNNVLGKDLLCWHRAIGWVPETGWIMGLFVLNATHLELLFVDGFDLQQIAIVDFLADPVTGWSELAFSDPNLHAIFFARQEVPVGGGAIFVLDLQSTAVIDMTVVSDESVPPGGLVAEPVVIASGNHDLDGDGDSDLVAATRENFFCHVPSERIDAAQQMPDILAVPVPTMVGSGSARELSYRFDPPRPGLDVEKLEYAVWYRPSSVAPVQEPALCAPTEIDVTDVSVGDPIEKWILVPAPAQDPPIPFEEYESFYVQSRWIHSDGSRSPAFTFSWSTTTDNEQLLELYYAQSGSYRWTFQSGAPGGGTVEGPRVQPYGSGGGG